MKTVIGLFLVALFFLSACGPKPYFETHEGKKKQKHYNQIQFGQNSR